jgi:hypothetical protein
MASRLFTIEILGKEWFVDERLGEYRSVSNVGEPIVFLSNQEMDDMLSIKEIIDDHINFEIDGETLSKLRKSFCNVLEGDRVAIEEISKICSQDS